MHSIINASNVYSVFTPVQVHRRLCNFSPPPPAPPQSSMGAHAHAAVGVKLGCGTVMHCIAVYSGCKMTYSLRAVGYLGGILKNFSVDIKIV